MASEVWSLVLDARRIKPSILPPSYFLVDGDDWLDHILRSKGFENMSVDSVVRQLHQDLNNMGIQPIVFLERVPSKNHKSSKGILVETIDNQRAQLLQLRKTLKSLSVDIEECDSIKRVGAMLEFSKGMGLRAKYSCYIYGSPFLDLWAVKGVSYILFDTLTISKAGNMVQAPIWDRSIVAGALFVTEKQLAELLILVGNRYTAPFGRKGYRSASGGGIPHTFLEVENIDTKGIGGIHTKSNEYKADDMESLAAMRDWILQQGPSFTLKFNGKMSKYPVISPFPNAERAIEFSRTYYENGDLTKYYDLMIDMTEADLNTSGIVNRNDITKKSDIAFLPSSTNAAAAIMAAISGFGSSSSSNSSSSFGRNVTFIKKGNILDERIEGEVEQMIEKKESKKKESTKSSTTSKIEGKEIKKDNEMKKNKKETSMERISDKAIEVGNKKIDRNDGNKIENKRIVVVNSKNIIPTVTTIIPISVDANKGNQLRNLLGIKFGSSSAPTSTSITTALLKTNSVITTKNSANDVLVGPNISNNTSINDNYNDFNSKNKNNGNNNYNDDNNDNNCNNNKNSSNHNTNNNNNNNNNNNVPNKVINAALQKALKRDLDAPVRRSVNTVEGTAIQTTNLQGEAATVSIHPLSEPEPGPGTEFTDTPCSITLDKNDITASPNRKPISLLSQSNLPQSNKIETMSSPIKDSKSSPKNIISTSTSTSTSFSTSLASSLSTSVSLLSTQPTLPIDAYREKILNQIKAQRVSIIHGMTGCGKSSRYVQTHATHNSLFTVF